MQPKAVDPTKDRLNVEAVVGAVTGLGVKVKDGADVGGDIILIQVSALNGNPTVQVTGLHGAALRDSVRTVYNLVRGKYRELGIPEQRLKSQTVAVHLVRIAEPKEGPSAGLAFVVGIVSALTNRPVKAGFAFYRRSRPARRGGAGRRTAAQDRRGRTGRPQARRHPGGQRRRDRGAVAGNSRGRRRPSGGDDRGSVSAGSGRLGA